MHKTTIPLLLAGLLLTGSAAQAQTALIAHRSHGGAARTFRPSLVGADNFGLRIKRHITNKIEWVGGTRVVRHSYSVLSGSRSKRVSIDTLDLRKLGHPDLHTAIQSLRAAYPKARFVRFDERKMQVAWSGPN